MELYKEDWKGCKIAYERALKQSILDCKTHENAILLCIRMIERAKPMPISKEILKQRKANEIARKTYLEEARRKQAETAK